jgi:hypothetical protein
MLRLGLLALATLNPPAFLLAQNRPVKFERITLEEDFGQKQLCGVDFHRKNA